MAQEWHEADPGETAATHCNWMSLLVLLALPTAGLVIRIRAEERALLAALGEPYRRYAAVRQRLFPACGDVAVEHMKDANLQSHDQLALLADCADR